MTTIAGNSLSAALRRYWPLFLCGLLGSSLTCWIAIEASTTRAITYSQGSDYWEHAAALRQLMDTPWGAGNSHLASTEASPRYNPIYWLFALVGGAVGVDSLTLMSWSATFNIALFVGGAGWFFRSYFRSNLAPLYGYLVLFGSWWQGWHYSNVYQLKILPSVASYPSTCALGLTWVCLALATKLLRQGARPRTCIWLVVTCSLVLLVHPLTAVVVVLGLVGMAALEPDADRKSRRALLLSLAGGAVLAQLWPYYSPLEVVTGGTGFLDGWMGRAVVQATGGTLRRKPHQFYQFRGLLRAFGLALPGLFFASQMVFRRKHLFVPLGLFLTLTVFCANAFIKIPLGHRFVLLAMVFVHIAMVRGLLWVTPSNVAIPFRGHWRSWLRAVAIIGYLSIGAWHNLSTASQQVNRLVSRREKSPIVSYASKAAKLAGPSAIVFGSPKAIWPVAAFGSKVVALFHPNPLVRDHRQRRRDVKKFFSRKPSDSAKQALLKKYGATHVLVSSRQRNLLPGFLRGGKKFTKLAMGYRLYRLDPPTP